LCPLPASAGIYCGCRSVVCLGLIRRGAEFDSRTRYQMSTITKQIGTAVTAQSAEYDKCVSALSKESVLTAAQREEYVRKAQAAFSICSVIFGKSNGTLNKKTGIWLECEPCPMFKLCYDYRSALYISLEAIAKATTAKAASDAVAALNAAVKAVQL
jgi:hypothetical protein